MVELQQRLLLAVRLGYGGTSKVTGYVLRVNAGWWGEESSLKIQGRWQDAEEQWLSQKAKEVRAKEQAGTDLECSVMRPVTCAEEGGGVCFTVIIPLSHYYVPRPKNYNFYFPEKK